MFLLPVAFSDAALQAVMVAGEQLCEVDQQWFSTQFSILERPHNVPAHEVPYRIQIIVDELLKTFDARSNQYPTQKREWEVMGRMLRYVQALVKRDEILKTL